MVPRYRVAVWLAAATFALGTSPASRTIAGSPAGQGSPSGISRSACPASREPIPVGDPRLATFWTAAAAFDRARYGFSALPTTGDVIVEFHPNAGSAVIHTCQLSDRVYRTIHFRLTRGAARWIGEQQSYRSGRRFEDDDAGTVLEELVLDYETEPVAGFPLNRLTILYHGPPPAGPGRAAAPSLAQARRLLRRWGF